MQCGQGIPARVPKSVLKRSVAQLWPLGVVPALHGVAARSLLEATLEDPLPETVNEYAFKRKSDISLVFMPLRLLVERHRKMSDSLALLQLDLGMLGRLCFGPPWSTSGSRINSV